LPAIRYLSDSAPLHLGCSEDTVGCSVQIGPLRLRKAPPHTWCGQQPRTLAAHLGIHGPSVGNEPDGRLGPAPVTSFRVNPDTARSSKCYIRSGYWEDGRKSPRVKGTPGIRAAGTTRSRADETTCKALVWPFPSPLSMRVQVLLLLLTHEHNGCERSLPKDPCRYLPFLFPPFQLGGAGAAFPWILGGATSALSSLGRESPQPRFHCRLTTRSGRIRPLRTPSTAVPPHRANSEFRG
jgi:hypothetical protein